MNRAMTEHNDTIPAGIADRSREYWERLGWTVTLKPARRGQVRITCIKGVDRSDPNRARITS